MAAALDQWCSSTVQLLSTCTNMSENQGPIHIRLSLNFHVSASSIHMCMHQSVTVPLSLCSNITMSFDYTASFVTFFQILKYLLERNFMEYTFMILSCMHKTHATPPPPPPPPPPPSTSKFFSYGYH